MSKQKPDHYERTLGGIAASGATILFSLGMLAGGGLTAGIVLGLAGLLLGVTCAALARRNRRRAAGSR